MMTSSASSPPPLPISTRQPCAANRPKGVWTEPIIRNALRYTISPREYATLHKYIISRSRLLRRSAPAVVTVEKITSGNRSPGDRDGKEDKDPGNGADYNARALRHSLRVFIVTGVLMKIWAAGARRLTGKEHDPNVKKELLHRSPALRLSISLSTILLLYRLLFRFLTRLRGQLLDTSAAPFRRRNPHTAAALTSPYAPAIGASLAGLMLGIYPAQQLRVSIAIYALFRALEFGWNMYEEEGLVWGFKVGGKLKRERPWWFGSWMLQPFVFGQLLHAVVFDRECFPMVYGNFIFNNSTAYLHPRPRAYPAQLHWPKPYEVVDNLAEMARTNWPRYISPTLFPNKETLPPRLMAISPLTSRAHPLLTSLSCATLHPGDPSCLRTYLTFWLNSFPPIMRFFLLIHSVLALPSLKSLHSAPVSTLSRILFSSGRISTFVVGAISTAWASICFFQSWFPKTFFPTQRFFLGGFLAGLWAWVERRHGRGVFLYSARMSVDSLWKVGSKRRWWKGMRGGDVWVFVLAVMLTGVVYERDRRAIREKTYRKGISWIRGEGWIDWSAEEDEDSDDILKDE